MAEDHQKKPMNALAAIDEDTFSPSGIHVLVVDNDTLILAGLERMLRQCDYKVTTITSVSQAISLVMENKCSFDIVMSEVYLPGEDGFKLLEVVGVGLGLPVINFLFWTESAVMSVNGETNVVIQGITRGACNYLIKPIRLEEVRNLWQHVIRRRGRQYAHYVEIKNSHGDSSDIGRVAESSESTASKKGKQGDQVIKDISGLKEARVNWTPQLHQQFLKAVNESGLDKVVPKRILKTMNVPGLTRENVASHLQKYRLYLKRLNGIIPEPFPVASFQASGQGKSGGTMQIRQGGKTSALSPSSSSGSSSGLKAPPLRLELAGRDLDEVTLESLEQFRSHEHEEKLAAAANRGQVPPQLIAAPTNRNIYNVHVDQGSEGRPEIHRIPPTFHVGLFRKNPQEGGGHVDDFAAERYKLDFAEDLQNTKPPPSIVGLSTHQSQLQNPSTAAEIFEKNDAHRHEENWSMHELDKISEEDLLFNDFVEEDMEFDNYQINFLSLPTAASAMSELEYDVITNADNNMCQHS